MPAVLLYSMLTCVLSCSVTSNSATPWTAACQAPLSIGFSRQEHWSGLPFLLQDLPDPGIEPGSPAFPALAGRFFTSEPPGKPILHSTYHHMTSYISTCLLFTGFLPQPEYEPDEGRNFFYYCIPTSRTVAGTELPSLKGFGVNKKLGPNAISSTKLVQPLQSKFVTDSRLTRGIVSPPRAFIVYSCLFLRQVFIGVISSLDSHRPSPGNRAESGGPGVGVRRGGMEAGGRAKKQTHTKQNPRALAGQVAWDFRQGDTNSPGLLLRTEI